MFNPLPSPPFSKELSQLMKSIETCKREAQSAHTLTDQSHFKDRQLRDANMTDSERKARDMVLSTIQITEELDFSMDFEEWIGDQPVNQQSTSTELDDDGDQLNFLSARSSGHFENFQVHQANGVEQLTEDQLAGSLDADWLYEDRITLTLQQFPEQSKDIYIGICRRYGDAATRVMGDYVLMHIDLAFSRMMYMDSIIHLMSQGYRGLFTVRMATGLAKRLADACRCGDESKARRMMELMNHVRSLNMMESVYASLETTTSVETSRAVFDFLSFCREHDGLMNLSIVQDLVRDLTHAAVKQAPSVFGGDEQAALDLFDLLLRTPFCGVKVGANGISCSRHVAAAISRSCACINSNEMFRMMKRWVAMDNRPQDRLFCIVLGLYRSQVMSIRDENGEDLFHLITNAAGRCDEGAVSTLFDLTLLASGPAHVSERVNGMTGLDEWKIALLQQKLERYNDRS